MSAAARAAVCALLLPGAAIAQSPDFGELLAADPASWLQYGHDYGAHRFVRLADIDRGNVSYLRPVWSVETGGDNPRLEATPLVHDGVVYMAAGDSRVLALDAQTGARRWLFAPELPDAVGRVLCCGANNRGVALLDGLVFVGTVDARLIALDARTGVPAWQAVVADWEQGYSITGAPLAVRDMVVTGVAGGEYGIRGFVAALDARTGALRWRTHVIPGPGEAGHESWAGEAWRTGGGATWATGSYDAELDLVFWNTGNPAPWDCRLRPGDNKWTAGTVALEAATGEIAWGFQYTPGDCWDRDSVSTPVLAELTINGRALKALLHYDKNGYFYVLDRAHGRFVRGTAIVARMNWADGLDPASGRPIVNPDMVPGAGGGEIGPVLTGNQGGVSWQPLAWDPDRGVAYVLSNTLATSFDYLGADALAGAGPGDWYTAAVDAQYEVARVPQGGFVAFDPARGRETWRRSDSLPFYAGALATAAGLVFTGDLHGRALALDADTGALLWAHQTGAAIAGSPISYRLDGVQYVLFPSGMGGGEAHSPGAARTERPRLTAYALDRAAERRAGAGERLMEAPAALP